VLREKIGFTGIVITDDLMMNGASAYAGSLSEAAKQALLAGNDIILFSKTPGLHDRIWTYLASSMKEEKAFRDTVRKAARRILATKLKFLSGDAVPHVPDLAKIDRELSNPDAGAFFLDLASRSVTILGGKNGALPLTRENAGRVLLAGQYGDFFRAGLLAYPGAVSLRYPGQEDELISRAGNADTIIFCLSDETGLRLLRRLESLKKKVFVLSVLSPIYLEGAPWVDGAVAVYSYSPESFAAGFSAMLGRIDAAGTLPYE
jgi:beta-N-acetylhexosaminidase